MNANLPDSRRAAARARWLGEVAEKLREAERMLGRAGRFQGNGCEMALLQERIARLREEVDQLQRGCGRSSEVPVRDL